ncbi:hypothetical protein L7F22_018303 [Adiantum nelumboides]|nr:hypothetical protein [Adiantum nelumboides]
MMKMFKNTQVVANLRVCDLGSGPGLAGVSSLLAGARQVVFYDQEPLALFCSLLTVHANVPHATTNLPFVVQQMFADSTPEYIESLAYGLALSPEIFELKSSLKAMALTARAETFDWSRKEINSHSFDTLCPKHTMRSRAGVHKGAGMPLLNARVYENLTPKGKPKDYKEGGQAVKVEISQNL